MHTLQSLFHAYLAETSLEHRPSTHYQQRCFFGMVLRDLGPVPLVDCTPDLWRQWKATMSSRCARSTLHKYLSFLTRAFSYAVECDWLPLNPLAKVRKPSPGPSRVRFLADDERQRLLMACQMSRNWTLYPLVVLALATGGRKNELRGLRWSEVDLDAGAVRFVRTKTHLDRTVPVVGEALAVLRGLVTRQRPGVALVFARGDGTAPREMECAWSTARRVAGVRDFRFHDLRHTYASYLAMAGSDLRTIAELMGHRKVQQSFLYAHLLPSHTREAVQRMSDKFLT
jgi:integrase